MPFFSVIIPAYNRSQKLKHAIDSVLAQDEKDYEIIVVDDGSDDDTAKIADIYSGLVKYLFQENSGVSSARNRGIKASDCRYITLLDSDDTWHSTKLSRHREFIANHPVVRIHQTEDIWIRNGVRVNPGDRHKKPEGKIFIQSLQLCLISPSSVCIASEIFDRYGLFDEQLPACEDYDLWLRITPFEEIGLIREKLITRYAGHNDQLSSLYTGMDRFRIYSILRLLDESGDKIGKIYREAAIECAMKKAGILLNGAEKRDKKNTALKLKNIISQLEAGFYRQTDYQSLLRI